MKLNIKSYIELNYYLLKFFGVILGGMVLIINSGSSLAAVGPFAENLRGSLQRNGQDKPLHKSRAILKESRDLKFDIPVTYNKAVSRWIHYYQTKGKKYFRVWLERSFRFMPLIQNELSKADMPVDLAYMVMVESGFSSRAKSPAEAVGPWQFIETTGERYGLKRSWWLDERKDIKKSTLAAIRYLKDLYSEFGSWYLVAASYNMGEGGLRRQLKRCGGCDYWQLVKQGLLPAETKEYVPKILAAMLISKAPSLYGFRGLEKMEPVNYVVLRVPGGTDLGHLAVNVGSGLEAIRELNAELTLGYVPREVNFHYIRVPQKVATNVSRYFASNEKDPSRDLNNFNKVTQ